MSYNKNYYSIALMSILKGKNKKERNKILENIFFSCFFSPFFLLNNQNNQKKSTYCQSLFLEFIKFFKLNIFNLNFI